MNDIKSVSSACAFGIGPVALCSRGCGSRVHEGLSTAHARGEEPCSCSWHTRCLERNLPMRSISLALAAALTPVLASPRAHAVGLVDVAVGVKGFAGGNLWSTPSKIPAGYEGLGFAGSGGGFGW